MNLLFDIGHPAHVNLYKNIIKLLKIKGHKVLITVKDIPIAEELLNKYGLEFINLGVKPDSLKGKILNQIKYDLVLKKILKKTDIEIGIGGITVAHVSKFSKMNSIILDDDDDEVQPLFTKFAHPFCDILLSPVSLEGKRRKKDTIYYKGFHELAYLHPSRFFPDESVLKKAGLVRGEPYFVLRFNSFKAHHDVGVKGLSMEDKKKLIELLRLHGRIFITTEREIDPEFKKYKLKIEPHKIHSLLYYATMFIGDSQTMTSEAAVLGTPAIRSNSFVGRISYLEEEEKKYGLTYGYRPRETEKMFKKIKELLETPNLKEEWQRRREKMLKDKIDVTAFLVWFIENYPKSYRIMKENPDYQYNFK